MTTTETKTEADVEPKKSKAKKKKSTSPTQRSLKWLRARGYTCQVVEYWNGFANLRIDLFNWIDIIACKDGEGIIGVQVTSDSNVQKRRDKAIGNEKLMEWLICNGRLKVHGWAKKGPRGMRKLWAIRRNEITKITADTVEWEVLEDG